MKIKNIAKTTVSEVHLHGNSKKDVQVQGVKLKLNQRLITNK